MKEIRGIFSLSVQYESNDYASWDERGATDIFNNGAQPLDGNGELNPELVSQLTNVINKCQGLNLNLYADISPFLRGDLTWTTPEDTSHLYNIKNAIVELLTTTPEIKGICFDDLNYPIGIDGYPSGFWLTEDVEGSSEYLNIWAGEIQNVTQDYGVLLGGFTMPSNMLGVDHSTLHQYLDFDSPEWYWYGGDENIILKSLRNNCETFTGYMGKKLVPIFLVFDSLDTSRVRLSDKIIEERMRTAIKSGCGGYVLFNSNSDSAGNKGVSSTLKFIKTKTGMLGTGQLIRYIE